MRQIALVRIVSNRKGYILSKDFDMLPFEHVAGLLQPTTLDCSAINSAQSESAFTIVLEP